MADVESTKWTLSIEACFNQLSARDMHHDKEFALRLARGMANPLGS